MKLAALLLFLHLSQAYKNINECAIDYRSMKNVWEERLDEKIMLNYDNSMPPKPFNGSKYISINPSFIVKSFKFLSEKQEFSVYTWTHLTWRDERLKWDPKEYDGIEETVKKSYDLWLPGIKLNNSISDLYDQSNNRFTNCRINSNSIVECVSLITFRVKCATDLNDWPFDTQVCSLEFQTWVAQANIVRFDVVGYCVLFIGSEYGTEWDIMDYKQEENQTHRSLKLYFTLMRHAGGLVAIVIYPSILISLLTLSTIFLDVRRENRVFMTCFSLMCHFYFLSELGLDIPKHSKNSPRILLYFRGSVIMTTISIVLTFLFKFLCERKVPVPNFVAIVNENVYKTYGKLVIRPRWEAETDDDEKRELAKAWIDFVSLLNSIWFYVSLTVYIIMCCILIPSPSGLKQKIYAMYYDFE